GRRRGLCHGFRTGRSTNHVQRRSPTTAMVNGHRASEWSDREPVLREPLRTRSRPDHSVEFARLPPRVRAIRARLAASEIELTLLSTAPFTAEFSNSRAMGISARIAARIVITGPERHLWR